MIKQGSVDIKVVALGIVKTIQLLDVQYAANLERKYYIKAKGCVLENREERRVLTSGSQGTPIMDVHRTNNVLVVKVLGPHATVTGSPREAMTAVINSTEYDSNSDFQ